MSHPTLGRLRELVVLCLVGWGACAIAAPMATAKPEPGTFTLGLEPWLGYGQLHVAKAQGIFQKQGLEKVDLVTFNEDKDINAALAAGKVDAAAVATHTAMGMIANGLKVKVVLLLDQSLTADAIIAGADITSLADLKGRTVAFERGATSDILLHRALAAAGLKWSEITPAPMPANAAGMALVSGKVAVAVTYEPYLSLALGSDSRVHMIYSGKDDPGIISDVLVVRDEVIARRPGQVMALIRSWDAALTHYKKDTLFDRGVIAKAVGAPPDELASAFDGIHYYSLQDNGEQLGGSFSEQTFPHVLQAAMAAGLVTRHVTPKQMIDTRFVQAAP